MTVRDGFGTQENFHIIKKDKKLGMVEDGGG